jgi:hypothetical protein
MKVSSFVSGVVNEVARQLVNTANPVIWKYALKMWFFFLRTVSRIIMYLAILQIFMTPHTLKLRKFNFYQVVLLHITFQKFQELLLHQSQHLM